MLGWDQTKTGWVTIGEARYSSPQCKVVDSTHHHSPGEVRKKKRVFTPHYAHGYALQITHSKQNNSPYLRYNCISILFELIRGL